MVLLGERLRRLQMLAVILAAIGVAQQVWHVGSLPWVSLALPLTFAFYGLIRKKAPVAALPGLVVETWMLVPLALIWLAPLVCFNAAARHLPFTTLGFLQYIAPTLVLLLAVLLYGEHLTTSTIITFAFIWAGLAIYSVDIWLKSRGRH